MPDNKSGRRIIAIAVSPTAYNEIQKLKGDQTWTEFTLHAVDKLVGGNEILESEIDALPKPKEPKMAIAKAPKVKKEKKEKATVASSQPKSQKIISLEEAKAVAARLAPPKAEASKVTKLAPGE